MIISAYGTDMDIAERIMLPLSDIKNIGIGLFKDGIVLLTGDPGMGKTTICTYLKKKNPFKFKSIEILKGLDFDFLNKAETLKGYRGENKLVIIDGIDQVLDSSTTFKILEAVLEANKNGIKILLTSRKSSANKDFLEHAFLVEMEPWTKANVLEYIKSIAYNNQLSTHLINQVSEVSEYFNHSPNMVNLALVLFAENNNLTATDIIRRIAGDIHYKSSFLNEVNKPEIWLPETPKIITDVKVVNSNLIEMAKNDPDYVYRMGWEKFEEFVAELFEKEGYKVTLTPKTRDGGKDIILIPKLSAIDNFIIYVECKNYGRDKPVQAGLVSQLYGRVQRDRVTAGIVVTSSYFTPDAKQYAEDIKTQLSLMDFMSLKKLLNENCIK